MTKMMSVAPAQPVSGQSAVRGGAPKGAEGRHGRGIAYCLAATVSFGLMFPVMASAFAHIDPFTFTSLRYLIAAAISLVLLRAREGRDAFRANGEPIALAWFLGSVGFAGFGFLVFLGQQLAGRDGALTASIMAATQPLLGVLVGAAARRVLPSRHTLGLVLLAFAGVVLVITRGDFAGLLDGSQNYSADGLILLGLICWLVYTFGAGRFATWSPLKYTTLTMSLGLTTIVAINLLLLAVDAIVWPAPADFAAVIPHILYMSLIGSLVGVLCWNLGNKILTPANGMLFMHVVPITAFVVSAATGIRPTPIQILGACITGSALILNSFYLRHQARRVGRP